MAMAIRTLWRSILSTLLIGLTASSGLHAQAGKTLTFGFAPGPYSELFKTAVQPSLVKKGYRIQIREFSDYVQPDLALANGGIDANLFQHLLYLTQFAKDHNLKLAPVISVPTAGQGLYSRKIKSIDELKRGDVITLSNDATNLARTLRFLAKLGLVTFKPGISPTTASEKDIDRNPRGLVFKLLEAAQLPRTLDSATASVVNGNFAIAAGLNLHDAIKMEELDENTKNLFAVRTEDLDKPWVKDLKEIVQSNEFAAAIDNPKSMFRSFQKPQWLVDKLKTAKK
jgi:D-methionine transport system substrate-binding protein